MRMYFIFALLLLAVVPADALQIGDGQYRGDYNNVSLDTSQTKFNAVNAADSMAIGTIVSWSQATEPDDSWLECDGQAVDATKYPQLYAMMTRTPNYKNLFLRAGDASNVGTRADDTIKTHTSTVAEHTHTWNGRLSSRAVSGTVNGFNYQKTVQLEDQILPTGTVAEWECGYIEQTCYDWCGGTWRYVGSKWRSFNNESQSHGWLCEACRNPSINRVIQCEKKPSEDSSVKVPTYGTNNAMTSNTTLASAEVVNGNVVGTIGDTRLTATYSGGTETAPKHVMTRYFIKAR